MATAIALFTRDLRLRDNPVLAAATKGADVVPLFVLDDDMLEGTTHGRPNRFGFLSESLADLDNSLRARGGSLVVRRGEWVAEVLRVAADCDARSVHLARDVSRYAQHRAARLAVAASEQGIEVVLHESLTVVPPDAFAKPYLVFTPYYRRWIAAEWRPLARLPRTIAPTVPLATDAIPDAASPGDWQGGETAGLVRLKAWTAAGLTGYDDRHDDPAADATSRISPYLHLGCLSALEVATRLRDRAGGEPFVRQICWRDFNSQLLWWRPETAIVDLRPSGAPVWRDDPDDLAAWKEGRTGFPLVDAGMRQLIAEGWMHNRVRMVVASFLTKDLRIDWRAGAAHFMDLLVDGDVANNQLNWQWVAGTGTDTNPFRVLNPTRQAEQHDPDGVYVRRWVPEYGTPAYPEPMVDHGEAIAAWREAKPSRTERN